MGKQRKRTCLLGEEDDLRSSEILRALGLEQAGLEQEEVRSSITIEQRGRHTVLIEEGSLNARLFVVLSGQLFVMKRGEKDFQHLIPTAVLLEQSNFIRQAKARYGKVFNYLHAKELVLGEYCLTTGGHSTTTVIPSTECTVAQVAGVVRQRAIEQFRQRYRTKKQFFLTHFSDVFQSLSKAELFGAFRDFEFVQAHAGSYLFRERKPKSGLAILKQGTVIIEKQARHKGSIRKVPMAILERPGFIISFHSKANLLELHQFNAYCKEQSEFVQITNRNFARLPEEVRTKFEVMKELQSRQLNERTRRFEKNKELMSLQSESPSGKFSVELLNLRSQLPYQLSPHQEKRLRYLKEVKSGETISSIIDWEQKRPKKRNKMLKYFQSIAKNNHSSLVHSRSQCREAPAMSSTDGRLKHNLHASLRIKKDQTLSSLRLQKGQPLSTLRLQKGQPHLRQEKAQPLSSLRQESESIFEKVSRKFKQACDSRY